MAFEPVTELARKKPPRKKRPPKKKGKRNG